MARRFLFAWREVKVSSMTAEKKVREAIREHLARPKERSSLFWWFLENHQWIEEQRGVHRLMWTALCPEFAELGLTDRTGKPPSPKVAKLTWERVCKEKSRIEARRAAADAARSAKAAANPRRNMPSQFGKKPICPTVVVEQKNGHEPPPLKDREKVWNENYGRDEKGYIQAANDIQEHRNLASHAKRRQERNEGVGRDPDEGIELLIGPKEEGKR